MEQEITFIPDDTKNDSEIPETNTVNVAEPNKNEIPDIIFSALSAEDIVSNAEKLLKEYPLDAIRSTFDSLPAIFEKRYKDEREKALAVFINAGHVPEDFENPGTTKENFYSLYKKYKEKRHDANKKIEVEREANLQVKLQIIEELKELVQKEESLGKTFQDFQNLQERWRHAGMVPQQKMGDLLETYHLHVENFYSYIKINKDLRDLDLKKNLDAKNQLCEEAEKLLECNDIAEAFKQLQTLHIRWRETGPVAKEVKENIWERFKATSGLINEKCHTFFDNIRKEQEENLKRKEEIRQKIAVLNEGEYKDFNTWNNAAKSVQELQEEWKHVGNVPQKERNGSYKELKDVCDLFYQKRKVFQKNIEEEQKKNLLLKVQLCEKVEALQESSDWKSTTSKIIFYQNEWKKIGPTPKKQFDKIWERFRKACDTFFNRKSEHFKSQDSEQQANLELKKTLVEELKQTTLSENNEDNIRLLKEFQARWTAIGHIPLKEKDSLYEEFRSTINGYFDKMSISEHDRNVERFRAKMGTMDNGTHKDVKIVQEREKLVTQIRQLETDIHTWENNMGFISKSKSSAKLINELESKIEGTRERLSTLTEKLKIIDSMI